MRYLVIAPQLGYQLSGDMTPGGLLQFGRCLVRAMASFTEIEHLGIWCQVDPEGVEPLIERTARSYAHTNLKLDIRCFGQSRAELSMALLHANWHHFYDRVMYILVNQAVLHLLPFHSPYDVWEIGEELFLHRVASLKQRALRRADRVLSISYSTARLASQNISGLPLGKVVHLCLEPPLYNPEPVDDDLDNHPYLAEKRIPAALIVGNMHSNMLYKGHQELIAAWPMVLEICPQAQLWIVGLGNGRPILEQQVQALPHQVQRQIKFWGRVDDSTLHRLYANCRIFAMPSRGEGFGLVFVEAARYGVPSIAGKQDSAQEVVLDGETGLLVEQRPFDVAQACLRLLTDASLAEQMGHAARARYLQNFRFRHFCDRLAHVLDFAPPGM